MIVLDTNVVSELMRANPQPGVQKWLAAQTTARTFVTAISVAETIFGLAIMPAGARRQRLETLCAEIFDIDFEGRVLPFDRAAAQVYGELLAERKQRGRPMAQMDAQIASITRLHGATLATRNVRDFADCGIRVVDPWAG
ncbi:MAG: type II toxin-antitoxin system VapC family toxin [Rhodospirillaceae bacterium]|nr:type II toxin-antitoxin system VapC family toxin [Rhodospirillaceae bacterium]